MPSLSQSYDILLDVTNDLHDSVTIQLLRDYGRSSNAGVLLHPTETITLVLESGSSYHYAVKSRSKVANVTARAWRDIQCRVSHLFLSVAPELSGATHQPVNGVRVDHLWRDHRLCIWNDP